MEFFVKIITAIFQKSSVLDVRLGFEYASEMLCTHTQIKIYRETCWRKMKMIKIDLVLLVTRNLDPFLKPEEEEGNLAHQSSLLGFLVNKTNEI